MADDQESVDQFITEARKQLYPIIAERTPDALFEPGNEQELATHIEQIIFQWLDARNLRLERTLKVQLVVMVLGGIPALEGKEIDITVDDEEPGQELPQ